MIDGGQIGSIRSWAYFKPVIEGQRKSERLCAECNMNPRVGTLSRCIPCIKAAAQIDREQREARQAKSERQPACTAPCFRCAWPASTHVAQSCRWPSFER
jgi:hypothetical protein